MIFKIFKYNNQIIKMEEIVLCDKLIKVPNHRLKINKKYFFISTNQYQNDRYDKCDAFTGHYVSIRYEDDSDDHDNTNRIKWLRFNDLRNLVTFKKIKSWSFNSDYIQCYEKISYQQEIMEEKYLKIILRKIIGDNSFTHYLFEGIHIDYELISDDLVSDSKDYEVNEVLQINYNKYIYYKFVQVVYYTNQYLFYTYLYLRNCLFNFTSLHLLLTTLNLFYLLQWSGISIK